MTRRGPWVALLAIALLALPPPQALAQASPAAPAAYPWWPLNDAGPVFHIRIPVTVTNTHAFPLTNAPVAAEVDVASKLVQAGWVKTAAGDRDILKAFSLDTDSIRVVAMEDLTPPQPGTKSGQLRIVDPEVAGAKKYEVPSAVFPGSFKGHVTLPYDPASNPLITVLWRVPGTLQPGGQQFFMVYLDTQTNGKHPPSLDNGTRLGSALADLFWSGSGLTLYGQAFPWQQSLGQVRVMALEPQTTVTAFTTGPSGDQMIVPPNANFDNPMVLDQDQSRPMYISTGSPAFFKLVADKPIVAFASAAGFTPSIDEGVSGKDFYFALTAPAAYEQDTAYFVSPSGTPTTVRVQPVPNPTGAAFTFDLSNAQNPYPYTIGDRGAVFASRCDPPNPSPAGYAPLLPTAPGIYHAVVTSGGPVQLHMQPVEGMFQVPALDGSATGTRFFATPSWSDQYANPDNTCSAFNRFGRWAAAAVDGPSALSASSLDEGFQVDPLQNPPSPAPPPRPIGASPDGITESDRIFRSLDRPLDFEVAGSPVWLFAGLRPTVINPTPISPSYDTSPDVPLSGPLYGENVARNFTGLGPVNVVALFDDTALNVRTHYTLSGSLATQDELGAGGIVAYDSINAKTDRLDGIRIDASKPVLVYPTRAKSGMLAGLPAFLDAQLGPAEYRGHLLRLASAQGLDPVTGSASLGKPAVYAIQVTNLGRTATGDNLPDQVHLSLGAPTPGWTASLDRTDLNLGSETETVHLTVTPSETVNPGDLDLSGIVATSQASAKEGVNPPIQDRLEVVTRLTRNFAVGLWFDAENGFTAETKAVSPGTVTVPYTVVVKNQGSVEDTILFNLDQRSDSLTADGKPLGQIRLGAGKAAALTLLVTLAPGEMEHDTVLRATSLNAPSAFATITATTSVKTPSDLVLDAEQTLQVVDPGKQARFNLNLTNHGGDANVLFGVQGAAPASWGNATLFLVNPETGQLDPTPPRLSVAAGSPPTELLAVIQVPANATATEKASLRVSAVDVGAPTPQEVFLYALVRPLHLLNATLPPLPLEVSRLGAANPLPLRVRNQGNLDEFLQARVSNLPPGWTLQLPTEVAIPRGATQAFSANLTVPPSTPPGRYNVSIDLLAQDGNRTSLQIPALVGVFGEGNVSALQPLLAQPGVDAHAAFPVANHGNTPLAVTAEEVDGEPWRLAPSTPLLLPPGAKGAMEIAWQVPATAPDGNATHQARLVLTPVGGGAQAIRQPVSALVSVGRADLATASAQAYTGASGTVVKAVVRNLGNRDALDARVTLLAGGKAVDNVTLANLPALGARNVTLVAAWPSMGALSIQLDPENRIVERNEANNLAAVASLGSRSTPVPGTLLVALAALAAAWAGRKGKNP